MVGPVGSGKSSLLAALAGEMETVGGSCKVDTSKGVAYCAQVPWVLNATLRDNVTFGEAYDDGRFASVVAQCALKDDEAVTVVRTAKSGNEALTCPGPEGPSSLARAAYSTNSLVLLDDPLSAVDAHVSNT